MCARVCVCVRAYALLFEPLKKFSSL